VGFIAGRLGERGFGERGFGKLNRSLRPPAALLLASRGLRKRPFRATISFYFLGLDIALLAVLALRGLADAGGLAPLALFLMAATHVGKALGTKLLERIPPKAFRVVVLATVVLAGATGVATATRALLS